MRYFLELSYNGANYRGWQRQPGAPSVQQTIEDALSTLLGEKIEVTGAGRTDTGVHAAYYVAHFDVVDSDLPGKEAPHPALADPQSFVYHANSILPPDIAIKSVSPVVADGGAGRTGKHARYDAVEREYTYRISPRKDPFRTATAWQYTIPLDLRAMNEAAAHLLTVSDFTTFAKLGGGNKTNICRVTAARWRMTDDGELAFTIRADRFLRNMVRAIVGTLVDVGRGKITPEEFAAIVDARDLSLASGGAPAHGLFLTDIKYDTNLKLNRS